METTAGEQKRRNPRLTKPKAEFCEIMKNLGLPYPKKLGACVCVCCFLRTPPARPLARAEWCGSRAGVGHGCVAVGDADVSLPANLNCGV